MVNIFKIEKLKFFSKQVCSVSSLTLMLATSASYAANIEPVADAVATPTNGTAPLEVSLDGSGSSDSDGEIVSYAWTSSDGQATDGENATLTFESEGEYTIDLVVTDDFGAVNTNEAQQLIQVLAGSSTDIPPTASFTATPTSGNAPLTVELDATESSDDGEIVNYQWTSSNGQTAKGVTASLTFESQGEYEVSLVVEDNEGLNSVEAKETIIVTVAEIPTGNVDIGFIDLKDVYMTGEPVAITVSEISDNMMRAENVDLWVSVEMPGAELFITPESSFTSEFVPFKQNIDPSETMHTAFEIEALPSGLENEYIVRAIYVEAGGNPINQTVSSVEQTVNVVGINAEIAFDGMKNAYNVGETVTIVVKETSLIPRAEKVDLWVAVQMSTDNFLFMSSSAPSFFNVEPVAFAKAVDPSKTLHSIYEFVVPAGLEGNYTLLAVYMKEGISPIFRQDMQMSNIAVLPVELY